MIQIMSKLKLTRVNNSNEHKKELFNLLKMRNFLISHEGKISFSTHCQFVEDHPYRQWFFIEFCNKIIGSVKCFSIAEAPRAVAVIAAVLPIV